MTDKKTFGEFIRTKRTEKNFSRKDLAEILFVTESAVSKWERGISYPDITLIEDICKALDISEREFITASTDTETRKLKHEAKKFRIIRTSWFLIPTIAYGIALLTCFICNICINHTLSWFFIVLTSLLCAYSFIPGYTYFAKSKKLLVFTITSFSTICLLLLVCALYTDTLFWFATAVIGILIGYTLLFLPMLLSETNIRKFRFLISFTLTFFLTVFLLWIINIWHPFMLIPSIIITCYCFIPFLLSAVICIFPFNSFIKAGICTLLSNAIYYFAGYVVNRLFHLNENHYVINFAEWKRYLNGNINFICSLSFLLIGILLITAGIVKKRI